MSATKPNINRSYIESEATKKLATNGYQTGVNINNNVYYDNNNNIVININKNYNVSSSYSNIP